MPETLDDKFRRVNAIVDGTRTEAERLASRFMTDSPREDIIKLHQRVRQISDDLVHAAQTEGMRDYANMEWGPNAPDFIETAAAIQAAADAVADFIEENFPTVRSVLNAALNALSVPPAQQDALRGQMGANLDYLLTHQVQGSQVVSPVLPAAALTQLVTLLNALAAAATIES